MAVSPLKRRSRNIVRIPNAEVFTTFQLKTLFHYKILGSIIKLGIVIINFLIINWINFKEQTFRS